MILRYFIVMLLMLNLGAAGWWVFQPPAMPAAEDAHSPTLQLVSEASGMPSAMASVQPEANGKPAEALLPEGAPATETASQAAQAIVAADAAVSVAMPLEEPAASEPVATALRCYRLGPFADVAAQQRAQDRLAQHAAQVSAYDTAGKQAKAWRVFLPALPSREAAQQRASELKAAGVVDLFVISQGEEANSIALGRFSNENGARRRLAELQEKGVQAQLQPVGAATSQYWLDVRLPQTVARQTIAAIAPAQSLDCGKAR